MEVLRGSPVGVHNPGKRLAEDIPHATNSQAKLQIQVNNEDTPLKHSR
jgi:hypothetical protein